MDKVFIKDLEVYAYYGANEEEKVLGQRFLISIELDTNLRLAGKTDDLENTLNYAKIARMIEEKFSKKQCDLIETVAEEICELLLLDYSLIEKVKLRITKPWAPIRKHVEFVAIEIERQWHETYIGITTNLNIELIDNIEKELLKYKGNKIESISKEYNIGDSSEKHYYVLKLKTLNTLSEVIEQLKVIEEDIKVRFEVLIYDKFISEDKDLDIPNSKIINNKYILEALNEINPNLIHPLLHLRISDLL